MRADAADNPTGPDSWRQRLLSDLLDSVHVRGTHIFRMTLPAPWGLALDLNGTRDVLRRLRRYDGQEADGVHGSAFHIVASGSCWLDVGESAHRIRMSAGDFVLFPRADLHVIRDEPSTHPVGLVELLSTSPPAANGEVEAGGDGTVSRLVCGGLRFESFETNPLLAALPPVILVKGRGDGGAEWLRLTVQHVIDELDSGRAGMDVVVGRLADILFIGAVRNHVEESIESAQTGWFAAVRDQKIGRAIANLHSQPNRPWTVEALADGVALSRSAFASKFTHLVGEPPLRYLTRVRLDNAARRLSRTNEKLSVIAAAAGYDSAAAFTRAFQRHLRMTPGEYRRAHLGS